MDSIIPPDNNQTTHYDGSESGELLGPTTVLYFLVPVSPKMTIADRKSSTYSYVAYNLWKWFEVQVRSGRHNTLGP